MGLDGPRLILRRAQNCQRESGPTVQSNQNKSSLNHPIKVGELAEGTALGRASITGLRCEVGQTTEAWVGRPLRRRGPYGNGRNRCPV